MFILVVGFLLIVSNCYGQRYYHNYPGQRYYFVYPTIDYPKYYRHYSNRNHDYNQHPPMYLIEREKVNQPVNQQSYYPVANYKSGQRYKQPPHYLDYDDNDHHDDNNQRHNQPIRPHVRFFGQPAPYAHTHDNFDKETTIDEIQSKKINPIPHAFNPALRSSLTRLQQNEANYHRIKNPR